MDEERVLELLSINAMVHDKLHLILIETLVDSGSEILTEITKDKNFSKSDLEVMQSLNSAIGWNTLFSGLRGDHLVIDAFLLEKCIEPLKSLASALDYIKANRDNDADEMAGIDIAKHNTEEQLNHLGQAKLLLSANKDKDPGFEIFQDAFKESRKIMMSVMYKLLGEDLAQKFSDKIQKAAAIIMDFQSRVVDEVNKNKAGN